MKQRGRKSQASLAVLHPGPRLVSPPPVADAPPPAPRHLGEPEQQIWDDVVRDWKGSPASHAVLAAGLEAHMRARECRATIEEEGLTITGRDGQAKAHPLCMVEHAARKAFQQTFRQLGIKV